ncbi:GH32 C-terminal domain-containing protein [Paenibacillus sp. Soil750]|uniref:GH32 C-terminal domain-containing protein n=1 Tax=Paenibacillus sp. Soil750 TaxID=1736398 RepID=UPI0006FD752F|nr:GH32 C-terminal domain-containing protein [Paenibacillus sp. Soil750]KRE69695.1 endo-inulinase [Paenibacillus sp. Soil750]
MKIKWTQLRVLFFTMVIFASSIVINSPVSNAASSVVAQWNFNEGTGNVTKEQISQIDDPIHYFKPVPAIPEWKTDGISSSALLFDGYSTWVSHPAISIPQSKISVETWVAPRAYTWGDDFKLDAIVNQQSKNEKQGFLLGMYRYGTWSFQFGSNGTWYDVWSYEPLPKFEWSHIVATYDSAYDNAGGLVVLYLNGKQVASKRTPLNTLITSSANNLLIGTNNESTYGASPSLFPYHTFNGLIDELKIYNGALTATEVQNSYNSYLTNLGGNLPTPDLSFDRRVYNGDNDRPTYHAIAPQHWMNEPHASLFFNGQYHMFYQFNQQGPYWHNMHWGHWVSTDMVHWRDLPPALAPSLFQVDPDGDWTGSSVIDDSGNPALFFTAGNDAKATNKENVGLARSTYPTDHDNDLKRWDKDASLAVTQQDGQGIQGQFRDPFVFKDGSTWNMLVGSGVNGQGGTALVYTSSDMTNWQYKGPLYQNNLYPEKLGNVWELPVLLPIKDSLGNQKYIFMVSPVGGQARVFYWIGTWDNVTSKFKPDPGSDAPQLMDYGGFHFTGPSGFVDKSTSAYNTPNRTILNTIAQGNRSSQADSDAGWAHNAGLPVVLDLRPDGRLGINPISELQSLRGTQLLDIATDTSFTDANERLSHIQGDTLEIDMELAPGEADKVGMYVRKSPTSGEKTLLYYKKSTKEYGVDRTNTITGPPQQGIDSGTIDLAGDTVKLHIFLDKSMVESYLNGLKSITTRTYSKSDALGLELFGDVNPDTIKVKHLQIWNMNSAYTPVPVTGVSLNTESSQVFTGGKQTLYATVAPSNATNKDIVWISSNPAVATVTNGSVRGNSVGTAIITAKTRDGGFLATSTVTVIAPPASTPLTNGNFEAGDLSNWTVVRGNEFTDPAVVTQSPTWWGVQPFNQQGAFHLWGSNGGGGDTSIGELRSQTFTLGGNGQINFLVGGGIDIDNLYVAFVRSSDGKELYRTSGPGTYKDWPDHKGNTEQYTRKYWDATQYIGTSMYIRVVDNRSDSWGHINVDDFNIPVQATEQLPNHNFEAGNLSSWIVESGNAFTDGDVSSASTFWNPPQSFNKEGDYHFWGFNNGGDNRVGAMRSVSFVLGGNGLINLRVGGGQDINNLYVALVRASDNAILFKETGLNNEGYTVSNWDASAYIGTRCYIRVVDNSTGGFGHINLDAVNVPVQPGSLIGQLANHDFELGNLSGWNVKNGNAFTDGDVSPASTFWNPPQSFNKQGTYHYWGFNNGGDGQVGSMQSTNFLLGGDGQIDLLVGGGQDLNNLYVALVRASDNAILFKETGLNSEAYTRKNWNASAYIGTTCYIKIVDNAMGGFGHINVDDVNVPIRIP